MPQDFSKMSDQELLEFVKSKTQAATQPTMASPKTDYSKMSDQELVSFVNGKMKKAVEGPSLGEQAMDTLVGVGRTIDSYTGAPVRSALSELTRTTNEFGKPQPSVLGNIRDAGSAFVNQFGANPDLAPTGMDIAEKRLGLSAQPILPGTPSFAAAKGGIAPEANAPGVISQGGGLSPAGIVGTGIDVGADLTNVVPVGAAARAIGKGTAATGKLVLQGSEAALKAVPGGKFAKNVAVNTAKSIDRLVRPSQAEDFADLVAIGKKNGINMDEPLETIEFGVEETIGRKSRQIAEGPTGEPRRKAQDKFLGEVNDALERKIVEISGDAPMSRLEAGAHIRESYDRALDKLFGENTTTYNSIVDQYPGLKLSDGATKELSSKLNGIEKYAKGRVARGLSAEQVEQGKRLINAVSAIRRSNGSVKQSVEALQNIGEIAFPVRNSMAAIPPDIAKSQELYFTLRDSIIKTIEDDVKDGQALAGALKISNDQISSFLKERDKIMSVLGNPRIDPEKVFERLTSGSQSIETMQRLFSAEDFAKIKGAYLDQLIDRNKATGFASFAGLKSYLTNNKKVDLLEKLVGDPEKFNDIVEIATLGDRVGGQFNTSNTQNAKNFTEMLQYILRQPTDEATLEALKESARARSRGISLPSASPEKIKKTIDLFETSPLKEMTGTTGMASFDRNPKLLGSGQYFKVWDAEPWGMPGYVIKKPNTVWAEKDGIFDHVMKVQEAAPDLIEPSLLVRGKNGPYLVQRKGTKATYKQAAELEKKLQDSGIFSEIDDIKPAMRGEHDGGLPTPNNVMIIDGVPKVIDSDRLVLKKKGALSLPKLKDFAPNAVIQLPKNMYIQRRNEEKRK